MENKENKAAKTKRGTKPLDAETVSKIRELQEHITLLDMCRDRRVLLGYNSAMTALRGKNTSVDTRTKFEKIIKIFSKKIKN